MARNGDFLQLFTPKLVTCLREGYSPALFRADSIAGLTVAVVALPLAMALAIASGATPDKGLFTAIIAGFLISALGGSRLQIGGPTGAFVVVVYAVIEKQGYDGLLLATMMAGVILILMGLLKLGSAIKYIPHPVTTGFTSGIAVIIFSSQIKDLFGLSLGGDKLPGDMIPKLHMLARHIGTISPAAAAVGLGGIAIILAVRRWRPHWPGPLLAVGVGALAAWLLAQYAPGQRIETIGSVFGGIPHGLPAPAMPDITMERIRAVMPSAFTIALLGGIESLLSAVIADGIAGTRHRSNCELVAQGVANIASPLFGGLPATGAIARTVTNIRAGAKTPVAGIMHALFLLAFMLAAAPLANWFPLAALAGVLAVVAWNMAELPRFIALLRARDGETVVLLLTFFLTVLVDLTVAVGVGTVLATLMFMQRMSDATAVYSGASGLIDADQPDRMDDPIQPAVKLPGGVELFHINGPFFFGAAWRLDDTLDRLGRTPKLFILEMSQVPFIDATGAHALEGFIRRCAGRGTRVILCGLGEQAGAAVENMGHGAQPVRAATLAAALEIAQAETAA